MAEQWHVARGKEKFGPYTSAQLRQMAADGQVLPTDMVLKAGTQKWVPAKDVKGLFGPPTKPASAAPPPLPAPAQASFGDLAPPSAPANRKRHPGVPVWAWAAGGAGLVVVGVILIVVMSGKSSNKGPGNGEGKEDEQRAGDKGKAPRDVGPKAEYFAPKVDYTKGPNGQPLKEIREKDQGGAVVVYTAFQEGGNQVAHGKKTRFDAAGKRKISEQWYFNGYAHGPVLDYHPNGKLELQGGFKEGKQHGLFTEWFENGEMSRRRSYVDGDLHGTWTDWSEDGKSVTEMLFVKGLPQPFDLGKATRQQVETALDITADERRGTDREPLYMYNSRSDCNSDDYFFRIFGRPVSGYTPIKGGGSQTWAYRCAQGDLTLRVQFLPVRPSVILVKVVK